MEYQCGDTWNQIETILQTFDGPEMCDDDFKMQFERFKSGFENAPKVECVSCDNDPENITEDNVFREVIMENNTNNTNDDEVRLLQELIKRQVCYRNNIEKIWKDFEKYYIHEVVKSITTVPTVEGEYKIESTKNKSNIREEIKLRLIYYKRKIENLWNELAELVFFGPKAYFTKSSRTDF